ncbi:Ni/Fe hydrogenase subunit alpha [Archaeoglobus veneficus]|uniref:Hydrogen dehydrogenase n=1 Tax=Archaeoglobus veneficus (strain DSM 11195 / SNP6) TaxID=693661 RepID=F2KPP2_ARCVS|nr:nickel-dependent hydrogenase large subunit [Archaeoglobus veneficus]AEA47570.1 Hydrogen dehydrogenase [Archaeoglobus veneficus SNP6]
MSTKITIDPVTRLEGHGKIEIILNEEGNVDRAYFVIPELRGFEKFCVGRVAEDMPQITERICGVCPTAHHTASTKALDDLFGVEPPPAARKIRELIYSLFMLEDHALHFYILGGPDFIVGPNAPKAERNVVGVIKKVGVEVGKKVIGMRKEIRALMTHLGGKVVHPVFGLPGGVAKGIKEEERDGIIKLAEKGVEFAKFTLEVFHDIVLKNQEYVDLILSDAYRHETYYMGLVDENNCVNFYDGMVRVVSPEGKEYAKFHCSEYADYIAEHVEPWTYMRFPYLKNVGWKGFVDGAESGIYSVAPLARLNAAEGMATPEANEAYNEMYETVGEKPVHYSLANHWARVIEMVYAAERLLELAMDDELTDGYIRNIPDGVARKEGFGVVEAPRGTLFHHYCSDENGVLTKVNLIVATQQNAARMAMDIDRVAKALIKNGNVNDGILNMIEMAFRAYDPCHACATHAIGEMPLRINIRGPDGEILREIKV